MQSILTPPETSSRILKPGERAGKYLTFMLGKEEFSVGVLKVREIMGIQDITAIPQTPPYMKGVIDLRGKVTPVIDLRLKFGLPAVDYTERSCIIVVQVKNGSAAFVIGMVVDEVSEVIAKARGKVKILFDIDAVLTSQEIHRLEAVLP